MLLLLLARVTVFRDVVLAIAVAAAAVVANPRITATSVRQL